MKWSTSWIFVPSPRREGIGDEDPAEVCRDGSLPVLQLSGELDLATAPAVRAALNDACREASGDVLVDLSHVDFFDAVTMGIFADANDQLRKTAGHLTLLGVSSRQEELLRICSLEHLLAVAGRTDTTAGQS